MQSHVIVIVAQVVNFLILLGLLKWLLFDRIVRAMDERERKIADQLHEAERRQQDAQREADEVAEKHRQFEADRAQMLDEARQEADTQRKRMTAAARDEVDEQRRRWVDTLRQQEDAVVGQLQDRAAEALGRATRGAIKDLADVELQEPMVRGFIRRLGDLDPDVRRVMAKAMRAADASAIVASGEPLSDTARREITAALRKQFDSGVKPKFETSPELIAGVELRAGGQAVGWNVESYLEGFADTLRETFREQDT